MIKTATARVARSPLGALFLAAAVFVGGVLHAPSAIAGVPQAVTVRYGDLDLSRPADAAKFYTRILHAAKVVCAPEDYRVLLQVGGTHECVRATVEATVAHVAIPQLTAYHLVKSARHG